MTELTLEEKTAEEIIYRNSYVSLLGGETRRWLRSEIAKAIHQAKIDLLKDIAEDLQRVKNG